MNTFKKKSMYAAVCAGLAAAGAVGTAEAVHISPDGLGQVLVYPYYTARAGYATALTVINTQNNTKLVKVRFLEGKNSREVLDFNLYLSPSDVWTGGILATANGARLISNDNSCVTSTALFNGGVDTLNLPLNEFKNYQYTGSNADAPALTSLDRTREGYFEVIEMGVIDDNAVTGDAMAGTAATITGYIKHNSAGVPANCNALNNLEAFAGNTAAVQFPGPVAPAMGAYLFPPRGGLTGRANLFNGATGANFAYNATAFDAWSDTAQYSQPGDLTPSITAPSPSVSNVFTSAGVVTANWANARDAMSATIMRNSVINEFILDANTASQTDWIVTFPTKRAYVTTTAALAPFTSPFGNSGSCDPYSVAVFNREEGVPGTIAPSVPVSPLPPTAVVAGSQLCWEANVVPFASASLLGSTNINPLVLALQSFVNGATTVPGSITSPDFRSTQGPNGYMLMNFNQVTAVVPATVPPSSRQRLTPTSATLTPLGMAPAALAPGNHDGLPVLGMMLHNFQNTGVTSRYGGVINHNFTRQIQ
jgi:hypothetical protein